MNFSTSDLSSVLQNEVVDTRKNTLDSEEFHVAGLEGYDIESRPNSVKVTHALARKLSFEGRYWTIARRYRQFTRLHQSLLWEGLLSSKELPEVPKKRVYNRWKKRLRRVLPVPRMIDEYRRYIARSEIISQKKPNDSSEQVGRKMNSTQRTQVGAISTRRSEPRLSGMDWDQHRDELGARARNSCSKEQSEVFSESEDDDNDMSEEGNEGVLSRLQQLQVYVNALFAIPILVTESKVMKNFFEMPLPIDVNMISRHEGCDDVTRTTPSKESVSDDECERKVSVHGPFAMSMLLESELLDSESVQELRMFLSLGDAVSYCLTFSTKRDGWSIDTLYSLTNKKAPCIILLRALESQALIGAFIPVAISPPSPDVRGDGRTFVFRLDGDNAGYYKWENDSSSCERNICSGGNPLDERMTCSFRQAHQQFAIFTRDYIMIGGSSVYGTNALRIDGELQTCFSGPSDTFSNPALVPEERRQPFAIEDIEVFCGM